MTGKPKPQANAAGGAGGGSNGGGPPADEPPSPWWGQLTANMFVTGSMAFLFLWGAIHAPGAARSTTDALPPLLFMLCAALCLLLLVVTREGAAQTGSLSAVVLFTFAMIGIAGSNTSVSQLLLTLGEDFVRSNRQRWEVVALVSTAFMALIYLDSIDVIKEGFRNKRGVGGVNVINLLLGLSIFFIISALVNLHNPLYHYICVLLVTALFGGVDLYIWSMLKRNRDDKIRTFAHDSKSLFFLLDVPVFLGLIVLFAFFMTLECDDAFMASTLTGKASEIVDRSCIEAYPFLAGAIAFQMISFNAIYVFFAFGLHKKIEELVEG